MVKELWFTIMAVFIKVIGKISINLEEDIKNFQICLSIKVNISTENLKEVVNLYGRMDNFIKVNGKMV